MPKKKRLEIRTKVEKLDVYFIHGFLTQSYWARGRTLEEVQACIRNSLNFGLYLHEEQIGYARVVTDYVVFAYLLDVFIAEKHRGHGYANLLMKNILEHPKLSTIKIWRLGTDDAHGLYTRFGFQIAKHPEKLMELMK